MRHVIKVILISCYLVSLSESVQDTTLTSPPGISNSTSITSTSLKISTNENTNVAAAAAAAAAARPKDPELPIDLLTPDKVFLDPNVVLARIARDTYGNWNQGQRYNYWNPRQGYNGWTQGQRYDSWNQNANFGSPHERRPFGIQGFYRPNGLYKPEKSKRRSDVKRIQVTQRPFRVYPVFPG